MIGSGHFRNGWAAMYATAGFTYDLAWVHFFDKTTTYDDIKRECRCDWIYTAFPKSYNKY